MPRRLQRILLWFLALYLVVAVIAGRNIPQLYRLYLRGVATMGTVTQRVGDSGLNYVYVVRGRRFTGSARIGVGSIPITGVGDPIYVTYLPEYPALNVAGDVKDQLYANYEKCAEWLPWVALAVLILFIWNAMVREVWFTQVPFAGSRFDRLSRRLFGD